MLNCLTVYYCELWINTLPKDSTKDSWTKRDSRLNNANFTNLTLQWQRNCSLRTDYERRQAPVEMMYLRPWRLASP